MSSRFLDPKVPGGLLTTFGKEFTPTEELTLQQIAAGNYFVENETPTGTPNGSLQVFGLAHTANPITSVTVFADGAEQQYGVDFTVTGSGTTITFAVAPLTSTVLKVNYRRQP